MSHTQFFPGRAASLDPLAVSAAAAARLLQEAAEVRQALALARLLAAARLSGFDRVPAGQRLS